MAARVPSTNVPAPHDGAALLTGEQISAISRFPDANPNPVLRIDGDGHLIYANPASIGVLAALGVSIGDRVPAESGALEAVAQPRVRRARRRQSDLRRLAGPDQEPVTNLYGRT
jgi:hypothetical protein